MPLNKWVANGHVVHLIHANLKRTTEPVAVVPVVHTVDAVTTSTACNGDKLMMRDACYGTNDEFTSWLFGWALRNGKPQSHQIPKIRVFVRRLVKQIRGSALPPDYTLPEILEMLVLEMQTDKEDRHSETFLELSDAVRQMVQDIGCVIVRRATIKVIEGDVHTCPSCGTAFGSDAWIGW